MNIEFSYLYRDAGNFKQFGSVIFSNKECFAPEIIASMLKKSLIDELFFDPLLAEVPTLFFDDIDEELDHDWHEFENVKEVETPPNDWLQRDITTFIKLLADLPK